jgi:hypothetical protein
MPKGRIKEINLEDEINRIRAENVRRSEEANKARAEAPASAVAAASGAAKAARGSTIPGPIMTPLKDIREQNKKKRARPKMMMGIRG